jgi:GDSL-like lipase/acylhydrolase family protein
MNLARAMQPLVYLLAPVLIYQGKGLRRRIPRLPEAADPTGIAAGGNARVWLAVLGDSTAAGVGAKCHQDALAGMLAAAVAVQAGREVSWRAVARGGTTSRTARDLVPGLVDGDWRPDVVVALIGVNDLKNLRSLRDWDQDVPALLAAIGETTGGVLVIVSGMAPVSRFPRVAAADARRDGPAGQGDGPHAAPRGRRWSRAGEPADDRQRLLCRGRVPSIQPGIPCAGRRTRRTAARAVGTLRGRPASRRRAGRAQPAAGLPGLRVLIPQAAAQRRLRSRPWSASGAG